MAATFTTDPGHLLSLTAINCWILLNKLSYKTVSFLQYFSRNPDSVILKYCDLLNSQCRRGRMNPGIRILPLTSVNGLPGGRMSGWRSERFLVLRMGNCSRRRIKCKLANGMKVWRGTHTTTLFSLKELEILHRATRGQVQYIVMEQCKAFPSTSPDLLTSSILVNTDSHSLVFHPYHVA